MTDKPPITPNLMTRISQAMGKIGAVTKDAKNTHQNYTYASVGAILAEVRGALSSEGVAFMPQVNDTTLTPVQTKNSTMTHALLDMTMTFFCGETGESHSVTWVAEAMDTGDKAISKAMTQGIKTFMKAWPLVPATDEAEPDSQSPELARSNKRPPQKGQQHGNQPRQSQQAARQLRQAPAKQNGNGDAYAQFSTGIDVATTDAQLKILGDQIRAAVERGDISKAQRDNLGRLFKAAGDRIEKERAKAKAQPATREPGSDDDWGEDDGGWADEEQGASYE